MGNRKRRADRTYKDLKQKQKAGIADGMFQKTCFINSREILILDLNKLPLKEKKT